MIDVLTECPRCGHEPHPAGECDGEIHRMNGRVDPCPCEVDIEQRVARHRR